MKAVILAAGVGSRLAPLTRDRPKALVEVLGKSFLFRQLELLARAGIASRDVVIVGGYKIDRLRDELARAGSDATVVVNDMFEPWNNFHSVLVAAPQLAGHDFLQLDGDTILDDQLLPRMLAASGDLLIATDVRGELDDETMKVRLRDGSATRVTAVSKRLDPARCAGEYIGIARVSATAGRVVFDELAKFPGEQLTHEYYEHAWHRLASTERAAIEIVDVHDCTVIEIDTVADLRQAEALLGRTP